MIVGFDFGTTNSLISIVSGDRVIDLLDETGRPYPSVVRYEGEEVTVGREARQAIEETGLGVHGNTVRSPKFLLGEEVISVGGVERSPVDIVTDVIRYVRHESMRRGQRSDLGSIDRAVVTIPVNMNGPRRAALREAFSMADISIAQFVHEPFAALYAYVRGSADPEGLLRKLKGRNVLVVDWGGGTLDLTLCQIEPDRIIQIRNGASEDVGGDEFDKIIRDEVVARFSASNSISDVDLPTQEARLRLLQVAERNKIDLSDRTTVTFYLPGYFSESGTTLEYSLSRVELEEITKPLVLSGVRQIDSLLESVGVAPGQVSLCLVAGGMAATPAIRSRLHEMFGPEKVVVPKNSATLVSQGAAWIAHDAQDLVLAKPIELEMARGSRLPLLRAGTPMPRDGEVRREGYDLYCTDPTDGTAKLSVVTPTAPIDQPQASDPRTFLGMTTIKVDETAPPLVERLHLAVEIDHNLILHVDAASSQRGDRARSSYFDLEFGIALPGIQTKFSDEPHQGQVAAPSGGLVVRANVADTKNEDLIPGDLLYKSKPYAFARMPGRHQATEAQRMEHLYYQPCAVCKRKWGDPYCKCATSSM